MLTITLHLTDAEAERLDCVAAMLEQLARPDPAERTLAAKLVAALADHEPPTVVIDDEDDQPTMLQPDIGGESGGA